MRMSRPFGAALLLGGVDSVGGPCLYHLDPTGRYSRWQAKAIGSQSRAAERILAQGLRACREGRGVAAAGEQEFVPHASEPSPGAGNAVAPCEERPLTIGEAARLAARVFVAIHQEQGEVDGDDGSDSLGRGPTREGGFGVELEMALVLGDGRTGFNALSKEEVDDLLRAT